MHENISIELGPMVRLLLEPYEAILDRLFREGRISASERDQFHQEVLASRDRLEANPVSIPVNIPDRYRSD